MFNAYHWNKTILKHLSNSKRGIFCQLKKSFNSLKKNLHKSHPSVDAHNPAQYLPCHSHLILSQSWLVTILYMLCFRVGKFVPLATLSLFMPYPKITWQKNVLCHSCGIKWPKIHWLLPLSTFVIHHQIETKEILMFFEVYVTSFLLLI